jgi:hypothetical protein
VQDAAQVHVDHLVPVIQLAGPQRSIDGHPCDARQHVEAAEPLCGQVHERAKVLRPGHVGAPVRHLTAAGRDGAGG